MSAIQLVYPVGKNWVISQDFDGHVATAKKYGWCIAPGSNCPNGYYYPGIDWACANRTKGRIAAAGVVTKAGLDPTTAKDPSRGYGNRIQAMHDNGWQTVYAHLSEIYVGIGERVTPEKIAYLTNNTGYSTGPHIHFELRDEKGVPIDPAPYLVEDVAAPPDVYPAPIIAPTEIIIGLEATYRVIGDWMNVRSGPSTTDPIVGKSYRDDQIKGKNLHILNGWIEDDKGQYRALVYQGIVYLAEVKVV